jgi:glycosyltransferase involved in cell wall biosynthesis
LSVLAVIIPAKDEAENIGPLLERVRRVHVADHEVRVIVVDDGSSDGTGELARELGAVVVRHGVNRGLGAAVRTGLRAAVEAGASSVAYLDADLEYAPEDIPALVEPVLAGRADYVLGSRFLRRVEGMRLYRRVGNALFTGLVRSLTGARITDGQTGMRAFSRSASAAAEIVHDYNYAQVLTLDLLGKGFRLEEVPIRYRVRERGTSFVSWRYPFKVLPAIWRQVRSQ